MSTTSLTAGQVMEKVAALMNDTDRAVYTNTVILPYLNMAIDDLSGALQEHNMSPTNKTAAYITIPIGTVKVTPAEDASTPHYPIDLIEIELLSERLSGSSDAFVPMIRRDSLNYREAAQSLVEWAWRGQIIEFVSTGALTARELKLDYVAEGLSEAANESSTIGVINSRSYLQFRTASLCARYIGENPNRSQELGREAENALDQMLGIGAKARQIIYTRRRPFRAGYKTRGWF